MPNRRGEVPSPNGLGNPTPTGWFSVYKLFLASIEYGNSTYRLYSNLRYTTDHQIPPFPPSFLPHQGIRGNPSIRYTAFH